MSTVNIAQVAVGEGLASHIPNINPVNAVPEWFTSSLATVYNTTMVVSSLDSVPTSPQPLPAHNPAAATTRQILSRPAKQTKWRIAVIGSDAIIVAEVSPSSLPTNLATMKSAGGVAIPGNSVVEFGVGTEGHCLAFLQI